MIWDGTSVGRYALKWLPQPGLPLGGRGVERHAWDPPDLAWAAGLSVPHTRLPLWLFVAPRSSTQWEIRDGVEPRFFGAATNSHRVCGTEDTLVSQFDGALPRLDRIHAPPCHNASGGACPFASLSRALARAGLASEGALALMSPFDIF